MATRDSDPMAANDNPPGPAQSGDHRVCFIGDSFVQGTCDPSGLGWGGRLAVEARARGFDLTHYNLGIRRDTSRQVAMRWRAECAARLPDGCERYVVFSLGVNDTTLEQGAPHVALAESVANLRAMLLEATRSYRVLVVGPPPIADAGQNRRIVALCKAFAETSRALELDYLPVAERLLGEPVWMDEVAAHDGAHPGAAGYDLLAAIVGAWPAWWFRDEGGYRGEER